jgi:hypothetical protein
VASIFSRSLYSLDTSGSVERLEAEVVDAGGDCGESRAGGKGKMPRVGSAAEDEERVEEACSSGVGAAGGKQSQLSLFVCEREKRIKESNFAGNSSRI